MFLLLTRYHFWSDNIIYSSDSFSGSYFLRCQENVYIFKYFLSLIKLGSFFKQVISAELTEPFTLDFVWEVCVLFVKMWMICGCGCGVVWFQMVSGLCFGLKLWRNWGIPLKRPSGVGGYWKVTMQISLNLWARHNPIISHPQVC
jgi:hypothetical protein